MSVDLTHIAIKLCDDNARAICHMGEVCHLMVHADNQKTGFKFVAQHYLEANVYFKKAAEMGCARAMYLLGVVYLQGYGAKPSERLMQQWFAKAKALQYKPELDFPKGHWAL
jgi:TPR repeat protein